MWTSSISSVSLSSAAGASEPPRAAMTKEHSDLQPLQHANLNTEYKRITIIDSRLLVLTVKKTEGQEQTWPYSRIVKFLNKRTLTKAGKTPVSACMGACKCVFYYCNQKPSNWILYI